MTDELKSELLIEFHAELEEPLRLGDTPHGNRRIVYVSYRGVFHGGAEGSDLYFRTTPHFETASEKYGWLNRIVAVGVGGVGKFGQSSVSYKVYEIL